MTILRALHCASIVARFGGELFVQDTNTVTIAPVLLGRIDAQHGLGGCTGHRGAGGVGGGRSSRHWLPGLVRQQAVRRRGVAVDNDFDALVVDVTGG